MQKRDGFDYFDSFARQAAFALEMALNLESANRPPLPTFPSWRPRRELDFVCHSPELRLQRRRLPRVRLSDHLPLVCDFTLSDAPETTQDQGDNPYGKAQTPA